MLNINCKKSGNIDNEKCFKCYNTNNMRLEFQTRVLCKRENVTEEFLYETVEVSTKVEKVPALEKEQTVFA